MGCDVLKCDFCGESVMEGRNDWDCDKCGAQCNEGTGWRWLKKLDGAEGCGISPSVMKGTTMPWDRGNSGWDNYGDFLQWLTDKMGPGHEEWISDTPSILMAVFESFAEDIRKEIS